MNNLLQNIPDAMPDELFETLLSAESFRVERIVSQGHASPDDFWYDQDQHEWVLLLQGHAKLRLEGESEAIELTAGDYLNIAAHQRHRVDWTDPGQRTVWLAIHYSSDCDG